jgi:hypothetical protein
MFQCSFLTLFNTRKIVNPQHAYAERRGGWRYSSYPFTTGHHGPAALSLRMTHYPMYRFGGPQEINMKPNYYVIPTI